MRNLYDWTLRMGQSRHALWALAFIAFIESSVFPIPPDIIMIPMILAMPQRAFLIAGVALVSSVAGGMLGYLIGAQFYDQIGAPILEGLGEADKMAEFNQRFNDFGFWPVLIAGITPFPYKVITIMSGWTGLPFGTFVVSSIVARGIRFFVVAALLWKFGAPIRDFIEKRLGLVFTIFVILLLSGFFLVKYL
jgi:membrane protein YqaA with SNARE-associated domain